MVVRRENFTEVNGGSEDDHDRRRCARSDGGEQCGHPCANKDARQAEPLRTLIHEGALVHTLTPRSAAVATDAARHLTSYHAAGAMSATAAPGIGVLIVIVVIILVMTGLARAARSLAGLLSELLRVATAVTTVLLTTVIAIFAGIAFLVH